MSRHYRQDNPIAEANAEPVEERRRLVAEAFHAFGEPAARRLAKTLHLTFENCRETIAQLKPPQS